MRIITAIAGFIISAGSSCMNNPFLAHADVPTNGSTSVITDGAIRVNIPYFGSSNIAFGQCAIFWFGAVRERDNYVDVRIGYNDRELYIYAAVFDKRIWFDENPNRDNLTKSDALTLYFATDENSTALSAHTFKCIGQMSGDSASKYRRTFIGSGGAWHDSAIGVATIPGWRGDALNNDGDDRGWVLTYRIPFSALGLSAAPAGGTTWRMAMILHDRDDAAGTFIEPTYWPDASVDELSPQTWARICFGLPRYTPSSTAVTDSALVRDRHQGLEVKEISVGGSSVCGHGRDFFTQWGDMNDPNNTTLVVQNQSDIADWPCFAKIFLSFPLDSLPKDKEVVSATLVMYLFGGSEPSQATPSWIQALIVSPWDSSVTTWNNSPAMLENVSGTWVEPCINFPGWPGVRYAWDVSYAIARTLASGKDTLYVGLYSADSDYHSGKYFVGAADDGWNEEGRPALHVYVGAPPNSAPPLLLAYGRKKHVMCCTAMYMNGSGLRHEISLPRFDLLGKTRTIGTASGFGVIHKEQ